MAKNKLHDTHKKQETAVLIGVVSQGVKIEQAEEYLDELAFLTLTAGARVVKRFLQRLPKPHAGTFVGEGKLEEIALFVKEQEIDIVIFDDELSPSQIRNLEQSIQCKILDRTNLILDIFANRARSAQAKMQVELAQAQYLLPRLTRMWTHLTKHAGGIGTRGPGESEIETDRRVIRETISKFKANLKAIDQQADTRRKNRDDKVRLTLVGYTNVGKSTILNMLSKSDVLAEDKLFATLDSTVRKVVVDNIPFLLTDTVGFIRKLPHQLIECFKSTLDEIREADVLVHVVDVSHPGFEDQINVVNKTLEEIKANKKPTLLVFNKIDKLLEPLKMPDEAVEEEEHEEDEEQVAPLPYIERLKNTWMAKENAPVIFISAQTKTNVDELKQAILALVKQHSKVNYNVIS